MKWIVLLLGLALAAPSGVIAAEKAVCRVCATLEGTNEPESVHAWRTYEGVRYATCSKECARKFDAQPASYIPASLPRPAPRLDAVDFAGKPVTLETYADKLLLLDFWATWCGPCRRSMPELQRLHEQYGKRGLVVLGVSVDEGGAQKKAKDLVASKKYGYKFAFDRGAEPSWNRFGVVAIPAAFLIDGDGNIVAEWIGTPADPAAIESEIKARLRP